MVASLQPLFTAIDSVKDERDLKTDVTSKLGEHFAATRSGIFFFDQISQLAPSIQKILKVALSIRQGEATPTTVTPLPVISPSVTHPYMKAW
jgi:hypothetical protein